MAGGFDSLGLMPELIRAVSDLSWYLPTDVQDEAIPLLLGGGDVLAAAETGSGKTGAFSLPLVQLVHEALRREAAEKPPPSEGGHAGKGRQHSGGGGGGAAVSVVPTEVRIDDADTDGLMALAAVGLSASTAGSKNWAGARATFGAKEGKHFFETTVCGDGICRFGWSTKAAHLELGRDGHGFGYGGTGKKSHNNEFLDYGQKYGNGDVLTCMIDFDAMVISYLLNGQSLGDAFSLDKKFKESVFFPAFCVKNCGFSVSFGPSVRFSAPPGFQPLALAGPHLISGKSSAAISTGRRTPRALVLEPARDLAEQVYNQILEVTRYITAPTLKAQLLVGGEQKKKKISADVDIIVGTPLRLLDLCRRGEIDLSLVRLLVLDEADRLLEAGTKDAVLALYAACPAGGTGGNRLQVRHMNTWIHGWICAIY
jgi:ATP-dependent RNA helicase DDX1